ncbi:PEGA domain-containing protein [Calditrichota bacterium]
MLTNKFFFVLILVIPSLVTGQIVDIYNVAVIDLDMSAGVTEGYKRPLSDRLRQELVKTGRFKVVERNNMEGILREQGFQMEDCSSDECAVEMGRLLGVQKIIAGSLAKVGETHTINVRMIDIESGEIVAAHSVDCRCNIDDVLTVRMKDAAQLLAGLSVSKEKILEKTLEKGDLYIKSNPAGAMIFIDGMLKTGVTPVLMEDVFAGQHQIRLTKDNLIVSTTVFVTPNEITRIELALQKGTSTLRITSTPFEAIVYLDSVEIGSTPQTIGAIKAGTHTLKLTLPGYSDYYEVVNLVVNKENRFDIIMEEESGIIINSTPSNADIKINGEYSGKSPLKVDGLSPGNYSIEAELYGYQPWIKDVGVKKGKIIPVDIVFQEFTTDLKVTSSVKWGTLTVDGNTKQTSFPMFITNLSVGKHEIMVSAEDHFPYKETIEIESTNRSPEINALLKMHQGTLGFSNLPEGTRVSLDGKDLGRAPINDMIVDVGEYRINLQRDGYKAGGKQIIHVSHDTDSQVEFNLTAKPMPRGIQRSILFPGLGQIRHKRKLQGVLYALGEVTALSFVGYSIYDFNSKVEDYNTASEAYEIARSQNVEAAYDAKIVAYDDIETAETMVMMAGITAGTIYIWNVLDAYLFNKPLFTDDLGLKQRNSQLVSMKIWQGISGYPVLGISLGFSIDPISRRHYE